MIRYISTRGRAPVLDFEAAVMAGLATDGGLYVPETIPVFTPQEITEMAGLSYPELALRVMSPFIGESVPRSDLKRIIDESYAGFRHSAVAPLKQLAHNEFLLELFHGPTLAFKDFALQFLGRLLEYFLLRGNKQLTIVGATSGDTGSAAIEGCRGRANMRIFILYPQGRVSEVQRRQMTTVLDDNVYNLALDGTFDDCQNAVKAMFTDLPFREAQSLTAVNSINWARILAQVVYYFYAALALGAPAREVNFTVPTGNFGDIFAGYIAKRMGLSMGKLVIATNENDILARTLATGSYTAAAVHPTYSPSMDIQISSNFERLLFDLYDRDASQVVKLMDDYKSSSAFMLSPHAHAQLTAGFAAGHADNAQTLATIKSVYESTGELLDPHTAVGVAVARKQAHDGVMVTLATAHPAKFPDAVKKATGVHPALPPHLSDLLTRPERAQQVKNDVKEIQCIIAA